MMHAFHEMVRKCYLNGVYVDNRKLRIIYHFSQEASVLLEIE